MSNKSKGLITYGRKFEDSEIRAYNVSSTVRFAEDIFPEIRFARQATWLIGPANMTREDVFFNRAFF